MNDQKVMSKSWVDLRTAMMTGSDEDVAGTRSQRSPRSVARLLRGLIHAENRTVHTGDSMEDKNSADRLRCQTMAEGALRSGGLSLVRKEIEAYATPKDSWSVGPVLWRLLALAAILLWLPYGADSTMRVVNREVVQATSGQWTRLAVVGMLLMLSTVVYGVVSQLLLVFVYPHLSNLELAFQTRITFGVLLMQAGLTLLAVGGSKLDEAGTAATTGSRFGLNTGVTCLLLGSILSFMFAAEANEGVIQDKRWQAHAQTVAVSFQEVSELIASSVAPSRELLVNAGYVVDTRSGGFKMPGSGSAALRNAPCYKGYATFDGSRTHLARSARGFVFVSSVTTAVGSLAVLVTG